MKEVVNITEIYDPIYLEIMWAILYQRLPNNII